MRRPITTDPAQVRELDGQQFVVLRPKEAVADEYRAVQSATLARLSSDLPHPHTEHVTLRGIREPERLAEVRALVREWASRLAPITVSAEAVDAFPEPWQIVIVRLARSESLVDAYSALTTALDETSFQRPGELPLEEWTFHLSVVYAKALPASEWDALTHSASQALRASEVITGAELVWYSGGVEHAETFPFGIS